MSESILVIFVGLIITIVGVIITLIHVTRKGKIELAGWTVLFCIFFYGLGLPLVFMGTYLGNNLPGKALYIMEYDTISIIYYGTLICIMMFTIYLGWLLFNNTDIVLFNKNNNNWQESLENTYKSKLCRFAWFLLILSFVTYYLYTLAYGGFIGLLSYTKAIRAGVSETTNQFSFFKQFGQFASISAFIFFALILDKNKTVIKKNIYVGAIISGLFSIYVFYSWGGRGSTLLFVMVYLLGFIYNKSEYFTKFLKKFVKFIPLLPLTFFVMDRLTSSTGNSNLFTIFISSISYQFIAFIANFNDNTFRWFQDLFYTPFYFLPSSIWRNKLNIDTANSYTTYLVTGARKGGISDGEVVTGTAPNDFLTFAYMQADVVGVIIVSLLFGMFLRLIHNKIMKIKIVSLKWVIYSYCIVHFAVQTIMGGDTSQVIIGNWAFFVSVVLFYIYVKFRLKNI